jgi:hypothetical protein
MARADLGGYRFRAVSGASSADLAEEMLVTGVAKTGTASLFALAGLRFAARIHLRCWSRLCLDHHYICGYNEITQIHCFHRNDESFL